MNLHSKRETLVSVSYLSLLYNKIPHGNNLKEVGSWVQRAQSSVWLLVS